ncbi:hypothetical protein AGMMS49525_11720 [Bacteroidia bacterium]|nr:hypothetical protein AGMMS49525_11720 [Bacteroidia bacterium]
MSYENLLLLQSSIPPYRGIEEDDKKTKSKKTSDKGKDKKENKKGIKHFNEVFDWF